MALAWARTQAEAQAQAGARPETSALSALLASSNGEVLPGTRSSYAQAEHATGGGDVGGGGGGSSAETSRTAGGVLAGGSALSGLPPGYVVVFSQVLPDGLGDLIFGENAVLELMDVASVAWLRCYTSEDSVAQGERLIEPTAARACFSLVCSNRTGFHESLRPESLEALWAGARERFLAPWIFGLSAHEESILRLARSTGGDFWALTEYGRGMGHIHSYTLGLGSMIPTGWSLDGDPAASGVFRSVRRARRTGTDWRGRFAERCGLAGRSPVRLWWFYSRRDDEKKHSFRMLGSRARGGEEAAPPVHLVAKVIPVGSDGDILLAHEKTSGEKLAEQLFQVANDPGFKPNIDVTSAELANGSAGGLSQFLWGILFDSSFIADDSRAEQVSEVVDIVVAPNIFTQLRASGGDHLTADVVRLDLVEHGGAQREVALPAGRRLIICSATIPRGEMRTFLEQCEERVFTTGDQSLAEAMFMGKLPCVRPDAKVQQWAAALRARAAGALEAAAPDLGEGLRRLVLSAGAREDARRRSRARSEALERRIAAQLGGGPEAWTPAQQVLARAGMLG